MFKFELGAKVKDVIDGFEGVITGRTEYMTGCVQYCVMPDKMDKDNKKLEGHWLDEGRLVLIKKPAKVLLDAMGRSEAAPGGPQSFTPKCR